LERALETGRCFVNNSFNFKSLKKDLYELWETDKEKIIESLNNPILNIPIQEQLQAFKKDYNALLLEVNQRIERGENKEIKIKKKVIIKAEKSKQDDKTGAVATAEMKANESEENGNKKDEEIREWTLTYPKKDSEINNPFYHQFPCVSLNQVLRLVNQHCHFLDAFTHVKPRYSKTKADEDSILGCITANATNYGIFQMSAISDIGYDRLFTTSQNFIRLETLKEGNDILVNGIGNLPIFKHWNLFDDLLISSSDGKKIQTRFKHILARHSSKYFGQKRGVVSLSMVLNNACTNTKIIPASDHESHHFFDVNFHNTSAIQPDWSCGDTHSINLLNFGLLPLIGQKFTPHIKNISKKACSLQSFENPDDYKDYLIVPEEKFNEKLIEEEWQNLQHIFASLLMKHTTQSIVVRKLSSHERGSKTQKALWEYDKILKDSHTLNFINDPRVRQVIRTAQ
jgi:TnpA family transposase